MRACYHPARRSKLALFKLPALAQTHPRSEKFKRYEDASLSYTGINRHGEMDVGLYDTVISSKEFRATVVNQPLN
jgi:hypothetical protein